MRRYLNHCLFILLISSSNCFALSQNEKLWLGINSKQTLNEHWTTFIFTQMRAINKSHPWQAGLVEGGIGYHYVKNQSFWVGYRWTGHHPYNGFYQENRFFQQFISEMNLTPSDQIVSRTRLEEIEHGNSSQISIRLRQRLALEMERTFICNTIRPFLYDELFFQLHDTQYTPNKLISENRIFIGVNLYTSHTTWWEIGYINQFQMKTPQDSQYAMSHIASFTYNLS